MAEVVVSERHYKFSIPHLKGFDAKNYYWKPLTRLFNRTCNIYGRACFVDVDAQLRRISKFHRSCRILLRACNYLLCIHGEDNSMQHSSREYLATSIVLICIYASEEFP